MLLKSIQITKTRKERVKSRTRPYAFGGKPSQFPGLFVSLLPFLFKHHGQTLRPCDDQELFHWTVNHTSHSDMPLHDSGHYPTNYPFIPSTAQATHLVVSRNSSFTFHVPSITEPFNATSYLSLKSTCSFNPDTTTLVLLTLF